MNNNVKNQEDSVLSLSGVSRIYMQGVNKINVLKNVDLNINRGEIVSLIGSSGSGKSSLLHIAGLLEQPDAGDITINGVKFSKMNDQERTISRRHSIGFIYQFHHLLSDFSAIDNVIIPMMISGQDKSHSQERAMMLLSKLGLGNRKDHLPSQLSGGEQQRVSIARAIANKPDLLLADEPTGNLDAKTADIVFDQFISLVRQENMSVLLATHNNKLSEKSDRVISIQNGELKEN